MDTLVHLEYVGHSLCVCDGVHLYVDVSHSALYSSYRGGGTQSGDKIMQGLITIFAYIIAYRQEIPLFFIWFSFQATFSNFL